MKITQIISETTAGCVATVAMPMGETQKRTKVSGLEPAEKVMFGKSKKKGPYGNSLNEGAMKQLSMDLKELKDEEFKKKYKMTKQEARKELSAKPEPIKEAELSEDDIILVPGQGRKMKTGFVPHGKSRVDHEVEMARSDLYSAAQNAQKVHAMIKHVSEDEGLEGWVQEKIIKANDYLNTIREYLEGKQVQGVTEGEGADEGIRPQGRILKRLRDIAIMSPTLTFQNFRQSGKEAIITDAIMACKIMKHHFLRNKNQPTAQFIYNLENELDDFRRGRKLDTPNGNSYTMDLSDLSRGTLGKMQFQTKEGVAEGKIK